MLFRSHMAEEGEFDKWYLTGATLLLFGGAAGKSAQFPFHVWLPDAMEGPTPVSALIHAATMVVAGVYLTARIMPLFEASHDIALYVVLALGMITTFLSIFMGLVATDIKKVVAYSTLNSLGFMMIALGFGESGIAPAMLYLFCHAFLKALLFLGCGSVIHATGSQELPELGGVKQKLPLTNWLFLIGVLSMAGVIPFSGFFAKDEILIQAKDYSLPVLLLILSSLPITAAYMMRLYMLTFLGEPRLQVAASAHADHGHDADTSHVADEHGTHEHQGSHESLVMTGPLLLLGILAGVAGFVVFKGVGEALGIGSGFVAAMENVFEADPHVAKFDGAMIAISTLLVLAGLAAAKYAWSGEMAPAKAAAARFPFFYQLFLNKFYIDDFYQWCINAIVLGFARVIAYFDRMVVNDTGIDGPGEATNAIGWALKLTQTGKLPNYALGMALGVVVLVIVGFSVKG